MSAPFAKVKLSPSMIACLRDAHDSRYLYEVRAGWKAPNGGIHSLRTVQALAGRGLLTVENYTTARLTKAGRAMRDLVVDNNLNGGDPHD